jgi:hypothetical protein
MGHCGLDLTPYLYASSCNYGHTLKKKSEVADSNMQIRFDDNDLEPVVTQVLAKVLAQREADSEKFGGRLAFTEPEAAALLGMKPYVLRDARLRGEVIGSRIGKRIFYSRDQLLKLLVQNQTEGR